MTNPEIPPKEATPKRAGRCIKVWLLPDEKAAIEVRAGQHSLSASGYLRALGLGCPVQSTIDQVAVEELAKVNGDLGRLGGLLKMWLSNTERVANEDRLTALLRRIEQTQAVIWEKVRHL